MNGSFRKSQSGDEKGEENPGDEAVDVQDKVAVVTLNSLLVFAFVAYILAFCYMEYSRAGFFIGFGVPVFNLLFRFSYLSVPLVLIGAFLVLLLVVMDVSHWQGSCLRSLAVLLIIISFCGMGAALLLSTGIFEFAPLAFFVLLVPTILVGVALAFFRRLDRLTLFRSMFWTLTVVTVAILVLWLVWLLHEDKMWNDCTKSEYYSILTVCNFHPENITNYTCTQDFDHPFCMTAFVVWLAPFILVLYSFTFALILHFLVRAERTKRNSSAAKVPVDPLAQAFICFITLGILGLWVAASVTSTSSGLGTAVLALSALGVLVAIVLAVALFGRKTLLDQIVKTPLGNKGAEFAHSDYGRAILVLVVAPLFIVHLCLNMITQQIRKHTCIGKKILDKEEAQSTFTLRTTKLINRIYAWEWGSVLVKALWWGVFYFVFFVGVTRFTTVFLSYLNEQLATVDFLVTLGIFLAVGVTMFLLPPVPGVPVYVTGGILLSSSAENSGIGFGYGLLIAIGTCFLLKLLAVVLQQKMIGELCGSRSVYIRYLVGINSVELRAMKVVLEKPGMTFSKVVVLVGGPDWPTSVLTGIMRLPLLQMLLGTLPVIFLIAPSCIAGAMLYKSGENSFYGSLEIVAVGAAVIVQSGALLGAFHYIAKMAVRNKAALEAMPPDEDVVEYQERKQRRLDMAKSLNKWSNLSSGVRLLHRLALALMIFACYCFQLLGSRCFEQFSITDSINTTLGGDPLNLVTDFGRYPLYAFTASFVHLFVFTIVQKSRVSRMIARAKERVEVLRSPHSTTRSTMNGSLART